MKLKFQRFHPFIHLIYYLSIIMITMSFHPIYLLISLITAIIQYTYIDKNGIIQRLKKMSLIFIFIAMINPLFNHEGTTVLAYYPSGNALTLEAISYGICSALLFCSILLWFLSFIKICHSGEQLYLFSKLSLRLSLLLSMLLRYLPYYQRFYEQLVFVGDVNQARLDIKTKISFRMKALSTLISYALEKSAKQSEAMRQRGYGLHKPTSYSKYIWHRYDYLFLLIIISINIIIIISMKLSNSFAFYPSLVAIDTSLIALGGYLLFIIDTLLIIMIERWMK